MKTLEELGYYFEAGEEQDRIYVKEIFNGKNISRFVSIRIFQEYYGKENKKFVKKEGTKYIKVIKDGKEKIKSELYSIGVLSEEELEAVLQVMREME